MRVPKGRKWTAGELSELRRLAFRAPLSTLAKALERSPLSIRTKAAHERLPLLDDLSSAPGPPPHDAARQAAHVGGARPLRPEPGDYVVLYQPRTLSGNPRLTIVCVSQRPEPTVIRATFSSAEEAGPRFEAQARQMAAASGTGCFRCVDGRYTRLDGADSEGNG